MSSGCGDVLSLADLQTAKKHQIFEAEVITGKSGGVASGADIDYATNQVTGQTQKTLPAVLRDSGFSPVSWDFSTGGTLTVNDRDKVVYDPVSKTWYSYTGSLPVIVPAGFNPVGNADWGPQTDPDLREDLASTSDALLGDNLIGVKIVADGAVGRTAHEKFQEAISITDFGATAGASGDQTAYIQSALNNKGYIYVPDGVYTVQNPLIVLSDTYIFGPGKITSTNQTDAVLKVHGVDNVTIKGIQVSRSLASNPGSSTLSCNVLISNSTRVVIDGIKSYTSSIGTSVLVTAESSDVKVVNGYYSTDGSYDASTAQTSSTVASPNAIFVDFAHDVLVKGNTCRNVGHGVMLQNVSGDTDSFNITVTENDIKGCSSYGIISYRSSASLYNVVISNNTIKDVYGTFYNSATPSTPYTHGSGIYGQNVRSHVISGNIIDNVCVNTNNFGTLSPAGIGFGSVTGFIIANNVISTSGSNGIILDGTDSIVDSNRISGCSRAGVRARTSTRVAIINNSIDCSLTGTQGVLLEDSASSGAHKYLRVTGNSIYASVAGISAVGLQNSLIQGNVIDSSTAASGTGISVSGSASYDTDVINNKVTMSAGYGIRCTASARVMGNQVNGASTGQSITAISTGYFKNNTADSAGSGSVFTEQNITAANTMTPLWISDAMIINVSGTTQINGIYNVPVGATVTLRVPSGITIGNLVGSDGVRFRFADGTSKTTTRTQLFQFVHMLNGVLDCVSSF